MDLKWAYIYIGCPLAVPKAGKDIHLEACQIVNGQTMLVVVHNLCIAHWNKSKWSDKILNCYEQCVLTQSKLVFKI